MTEQSSNVLPVFIHPEDMVRFQDHVDKVSVECRRILDMFVPIMEAYLTELSRTLRDLAESTEHIRSTSTPTPTRPAWQSPHGPAHRKRTR